MEILKITEQDDGSCILDCLFTQEEVGYFLNYAVTNILKEQLEKMENKDKEQK